MRTDHLDRIARRLRQRVVEMSHSAGTPHLGSALSCIDILVALYWSVLRIDSRDAGNPNRDRFILSKGHAALALYVTLAERGFFSDEILRTYNRNGGVLAEHPSPHSVPGVEAATGSLGHGLSIGLGMALAARIQQRDHRVLVLLSDGECNEGSVWEAAMFGAAQRLNNVTIIIDYNKWQATGRSDQTLAIAPLRQKWEAFGWNAIEVNGHSFEELIDAMAQTTSRPNAIIAHTIKGRGVSFMEDDNNWHYRVPNEDEVGRATRELQRA